MKAGEESGRIHPGTTTDTFSTMKFVETEAQRSDAKCLTENETGLSKHNYITDTLMATELLSSTRNAFSEHVSHTLPISGKDVSHSININFSKFDHNCKDRADLEIELDVKDEEIQGKSKKIKQFSFPREPNVHQKEKHECSLLLFLVISGSRVRCHFWFTCTLNITSASMWNHP